MAKKNPIVFIHAPRTGGTSLHSMLTTGLDDYNVCPARFYVDFKQYSNKDVKNFNLFSGHFGTKDCSVIKRAKYVTLLRNPVDRVVSLYSMWHNQKDTYTGSPEDDQNYYGVQLAINGTIEDFINTRDSRIISEISNTQSLYILSGLGESNINEVPEHKAVNKVIKKLEKNFTWFGTIDQLNENSNVLWEKLKVSPTNTIKTPRLNTVTDKNKAYISNKTYKHILDLNRVDYEVYKYVDAIEKYAMTHAKTEITPVRRMTEQYIVY